MIAESVNGTLIIEAVKMLLKEGRSCRFVARGWSMTPFIRDWDTIVVAPARMLSRGEVAVFTDTSGRLVVHRVVEIRGGEMVLKGDNTSGYDGVFGPDRILGRVVSVERRGRRAFAGLGPERVLHLRAQPRRRIFLPDQGAFDHKKGFLPGAK